MGKRLYVGNLPYEVDEAALRTAFGQDGRRVEGVNIVLDRETGRPRGFAFVEMASDEDAQRAIQAMDGSEFQGRRMRVNEAEDRRGPPRGGPRPRTGGAGPAGSSGSSDGHAPSGGGSAAPGGHAERARGRSQGFGEERRRGNEKKPARRRHDEDEQGGEARGRRGSRRYDGDDDEW